MRNIFDQYSQPENKLTHSLASCLYEDKKLLESYGYDYIYLWSLSFWKDPEGSFEKLLKIGYPD